MGVFPVPAGNHGEGDRMTVQSEVRKRSSLQQMLEPIRSILTPDVARGLVGLRADPEIQSRIESLAERHHEGQLSEDELADYEGLVNATDLIAVLQSQARSVLARPAA